MPVRVTIDGETATVADLRTRRFEEACVDHGEAGPFLIALVNGERGWLMYLDEPGNSGEQSTNPDYDGDPDAAIAYRLSNGQVDEYPASWAYDLARVRAALLEFATTKAPSATICWTLG